MTVLAADASNYTSDLSPGALANWKNFGVELVIIQSLDPPAGYPAGKTRQQIQQCLDAGLVVDAYVWCWFDLDVSDIQRKLSLLDGLPIRQLWLDVEDTAAAKYDQAACEQKVIDALTVCDSWAYNAGLPLQLTGIYSGDWFWADGKYMGNTTRFSDRKLWDANYDDIPDASQGFKPYGGWDHCAIKQYHGTMGLADVWGIDINALSDAEAALLHPAPGDDVDDQERQQYQDKIDGLTVTVADIADRIGDAILTECKRSSVRKTVLRGLVAQMEDERVQAVGPRPG